LHSVNAVNPVCCQCRIGKPEQKQTGGVLATRVRFSIQSNTRVAGPGWLLLSAVDQGYRFTRIHFPGPSGFPQAGLAVQQARITASRCLPGSVRAQAHQNEARLVAAAHRFDARVSRQVCSGMVGSIIYPFKTVCSLPVAQFLLNDD